ncbi:hypothetical protein [Amycolatopsis sp. TNS106]|uniref:hypothetical protein n=1 Tax=Amycolatopsis sp. TNS106 TaxID=2861750 RepID=UPI001C57528D|nr:hypothetical protein [Amycolatopsis sp. TNS106]QXV59396.1 hypothetical protein CVV72_21900 [Amycolatopsis sp. TNS106]
MRIPAGSPRCAREPRIEGLSEENGIIHACDQRRLVVDRLDFPQSPSLRVLDRDGRQVRGP